MTPEEVERLFRFLGYGVPPSARFLFLGEKEYTPAGTELRNCKIRASAFAVPWEDKNRATRLLADGFTKLGDPTNAHRFRQVLAPGRNFDWASGKPSGCSVSVWTWAAMFVTAWRAQSRCVANGPWFTSWAQEYSSLGTFESDVALAELYPLPMKSVTAWPSGYVETFGFKDAPAYFQGVFPIGQASPREQDLVRQVLSPLPTSSVVVAYGRGGNKAEFWRRYDHLLSPRLTAYEGRSARWHSLVRDTIEIGVSTRGHLIARVGFPWGRPNGHPVVQQHVPTLVEGLRALRAANP